jgi:hypothetical protein
MKFTKLLCVLLALVIVCSTAVYAQETPDESSTVDTNLLSETSVSDTSSTASAVSSQSDKEKAVQKLIEQKMQKFMAKNGLNKTNFSFAYYDFSRNFKYVYNGDRLFHAYESIKFPLAYLYFDKMSNGEVSFTSRLGTDTYKNVYLDSLSGDSMTSTNTLIQNYGGLYKVKTDMTKYSSSKESAQFYNSDMVSADYYIKFLDYYYKAAVYCSTDFKTYLIDPIKELSPGKFSEKNIDNCKITHRYGFSYSAKSAVDLGIVNTNYPFGLVVAVSASADAENVIADAAKLAYDFNNDYNSVLVQQQTTYPNISEKDKKAYNDNSVSQKELYAIIAAGVIAFAAIAFFYVRRNRKRIKEYRGED